MGQQMNRANADIKKILASWMRENKSLKWSLGLKFVQLQKNHVYHSGSKTSPYKATFGIETPMGLQSIDVPREAWSKLETGNDLFKLCGIDIGEGDEGFNLENNDDLDVDG